MISLKAGEGIIGDIRLAIFDKDGTLMELYHYWSQMVGLRARLICRRLGLGTEHVAGLTSAMGVDTARRRLKPEGPVGLLPREVVMQAAVDYLGSAGHAGTNDVCLDVFREVDATSSRNLAGFIKPIDGMPSLIEQLTRHGSKIALATTDRTERAELAVSYLGIGDKVSLVIGADAVRRSKPAPDMIDLILERLEIDKANAVMIGDAVTDVQMGVNAGLKASIGVCSGLTPEEQLRNITPYVVESIAQIRVVS